MAHVHGAKAATGAAKMIDSAMEGMEKMGGGMMQPMGGGMMHSMNPGASECIVAGVAATAGKSTLKKVLTHPVTLIGFGFVLGYLAYKYRKEILPTPEEE